MARRFWLATMALSLGATACGDSDDDAVYGPEVRQKDAEKICTAACERSAVCNEVDNPDLTECVDTCSADLIARSKANNKCTYTSADINGCAGAYDDFSCTSLEAGDGPSECSWTCNTGTSSSVAAPF